MFVFLIIYCVALLIFVFKIICFYVYISMCICLFWCYNNFLVIRSKVLCVPHPCNKSSSLITYPKFKFLTILCILQQYLHVNYYTWFTTKLFIFTGFRRHTSTQRWNMAVSPKIPNKLFWYMLRSKQPIHLMEVNINKPMHEIPQHNPIHKPCTLEPFLTNPLISIHHIFTQMYILLWSSQKRILPPC